MDYKCVLIQNKNLKTLIFIFNKINISQVSKRQECGVGKCVEKREPLNAVNGTSIIENTRKSLRKVKLE